MAKQLEDSNKMLYNRMEGISKGISYSMIEFRRHPFESTFFTYQAWEG